MLAFLYGTLAVLWFIVKWTLIVTLAVYGVGLLITAHHVRGKHSGHHEQAWSKSQSLVCGVLWPLVILHSFNNGQFAEWVDTFTDHFDAEFPESKPS